MNSKTDMRLAFAADKAGSEAFSDLISGTNRLLENGEALEAFRAFDDGALAEVPHALEAYLSRQRRCLN
ncbi:MAG: hypothetical protein PVG42_11765 [Lysobacterales bacterium]|jgi:hypothetical protein